MLYPISKIIMALLLIVVVSAQFSEVSGSDDLPSMFSLDGGSLTSVPADEKEPEPGFVTAKYGFRIAREFVPYVGTGVSYTYKPDARTGEITELRTGLAAQLGFSYLLGENGKLRVDYTHLSVNPEQQSGEPKAATRAIGFGLELKF